MTTIDADTPLPDELEAAHRLIRELLATLHHQTYLNAKLQHQLEQLLRQIYGKRSEKLDPNQLLLFAREFLEAAAPEPEPMATPEPETTREPEPTPAKRPSPGHGRKPLPAHLVRKPVLHDVPLQERPCPDCGVERRPMGQEVREQLEYVPASLIVLKHIRPKYACQSCQANVVIAQRLPGVVRPAWPKRIDIGQAPGVRENSGKQGV